MKKKNIKSSICETICQFVPQWKQVDIDQIVVERMSGITNETYKVSHPQLNPPLIFREFGDSSDNIFLNRQTQQFVYKFISKEGLGPKIMGMTEDIRIQSFIQSKVLKTNQMLQTGYIQDIAYALRRFHGLDPEKQISRQSLFDITFFKHDSPILDKCLKKLKSPIFTEQQYKKLQKIKNWFSNQQIQYVKNLVKKLDSCKLVFSHNDLLPGNVLITKEEKKIVFIDYQYSCFNYPVYDIANYFNQSLILYEVQDLPYYKILQKPQNFDQMIDKFIKNYVQAGNLSYFDYKDRVKVNSNLDEKQFEFYQQIKESYIIGQMLSHLMWGWWGLIVSKNPAIQFDYISFAEYRYDEYHKLKKKIQSKQKDDK